MSPRLPSTLLLLASVLAIAAPSSALDGGGIDTVFAVRKNTNENRVDYGIRLDAQCRPRGDEPVTPYFRRGNGSTRELSFLERSVYGIRGQNVRTEETGGGRVEFRLRAIPDRTIRIVTRNVEGRCAAAAITRVDGQPAVLTDIFVVLSNPRRVDYIEVTGRTVNGSQTVTEQLRD